MHSEFSLICFAIQNTQIESLTENRFNDIASSAIFQVHERCFTHHQVNLNISKYEMASRPTGKAPMAHQCAMAHRLGTTALGFLQAVEESADWVILSSFCDDSNLHIYSMYSSNYTSHVRQARNLSKIFNRKSVSY